MLGYMRDTWAGPARVSLSANMVEGNYDQADLDIRNLYGTKIDGMVIEAFGVTWRSGTWLSATRWDLDLRRVEDAIRRGDAVSLFAQGDRGDTTRQRFAFASALLVGDRNTSFRYHNTRVGYSNNWWYTNYDAPLGDPLGTRYVQGSTWRRDFTNGYVTVDPVAHTAQIVTR